MADRPKYNQEALAANVRRLAKARGLSLNKLADFAAVGRRHLYGVLAGQHDPSLGWCERIAIALDVGLAELVTEPDPQTRRAKRRAAG